MRKLNDLDIMIENNGNVLPCTLRLVVCGIMLMILLCVPPPCAIYAAVSETEGPVAGTQDSPDRAARQEMQAADPTDTLLLTIGYRGQDPQDYRIQRVFTLEELEAMELYLYDYTMIDDTSELIIEHAAGVRLAELLDNAGVSADDVERLHFLSESGGEMQTTSLSKEELLDTERFCHYSLLRYYDSETGTIRSHKKWTQETVEVLMALRDLWEPVSEGGGLDGEYEELMTQANRFRLVLGQVDPLEKNASLAVCGVHTIAVEYSGEPPEAKGMILSDSTNADSDIETSTSQNSPLDDGSDTIASPVAEAPEVMVVTSGTPIVQPTAAQNPADAGTMSMAVENTSSNTGTLSFVPSMPIHQTETVSEEAETNIYENIENTEISDKPGDEEAAEHLIPLQFRRSGSGKFADYSGRTDRIVWLTAGGIFLLSFLLRYIKFRYDFRPLNNKND